MVDQLGQFVVDRRLIVRACPDFLLQKQTWRVLPQSHRFLRQTFAELLSLPERAVAVKEVSIASSFSQ